MTLFQIEFEDSAIKSEDIKEVYKVRLILDPIQERTQDLYWFLDRVITLYCFLVQDTVRKLATSLQNQVHMYLFCTSWFHLPDVDFIFSLLCTIVLAMIKK